MMVGEGGVNGWLVWEEYLHGSTFAMLSVCVCV